MLPLENLSRDNSENKNAEQKVIINKKRRKKKLATPNNQ
jgi:hypothetical protein